MKVRCIMGDRYGDLTVGGIYEVLSIGEKSGWYKIIDASGEDYIYSPNMFEIVEKEPIPPIREPKIEIVKIIKDINFYKEKSDPPSMSEEEYFKVRDEYLQKIMKNHKK